MRARVRWWWYRYQWWTQARYEARHPHPTTTGTAPTVPRRRSITMPRRAPRTTPRPVHHRAIPSLHHVRRWRWHTRTTHSTTTVHVDPSTTHHTMIMR